MPSSGYFRGYTNIEKMISGFNRNGISWLVHMSGGEPFLFPNFIKFCEKLTQGHYISINTNLSTPNVFDFARKINPSRVKYIHASVHLRQRGNGLEEFIRKVIFLKRHGFKTFASFLMYPEDIIYFERTFRRLKTEGIILFPKLFRGIWRNEGLHPGIKRRMRKFPALRPLLKRTYPAEYSREEKRLIRFLSERSQELAGEDYFDSDCTIDLSKEMNWLDGLPSWRGRPCFTGSRYVRMDPWGKVTRCNTDHTLLGNLFEGEVKLMAGAQPCACPVCSCPYYGERYLADISQPQMNKEDSYEKAVIGVGTKNGSAVNSPVFERRFPCPEEN